ncbi:cytochrome P450 [Dichotomocladium elegans]|nr:cytochrome P450 [Dichotomocladium elegans]
MSALLAPFVDTPSQNMMTMVSGASAAVLGLLALKYNDRSIFTEPKEDVIFIKGHPLVGSLFKLIKNKDRLHDYVTYNFDRHNTMITEDSVIGRPAAVSTINPANVEYVLKTNFSNYIKGQQMKNAMGDLFGHGIFVANGEQWKYQRKAASLIFNVANFRDLFTEVFVEELHVMAKRIFDKKAENGTAVDFHDVMFKFTLDSFVLLGFGTQLNSLTSKKKVPFAESFDICQANCMDRFINPYNYVIEFLQPIFSPGTRSIRQHLKTIDQFAYDIIKQRRESGSNAKDLLSRFMLTRNENGEPLSDNELRDTILNFIIAGRDTTAQALSWTFFNLTLHPRIEAKLVEEIEKTIRDEHEADPPALYEAIRTMTYAHAVFYEVLRLYPSVPANVKVALEDDVLPDGTHIRKGESFTWSSYAMGRSTQVWGPDAKQFRPERWIDEEGKLRRESAGQWPAFHAGPRVCLGQNLATLEALVAITLLLRRYKFTLAPNQDITYAPSLTMPMANGMKVYVEKRN